MKDADIFKLAVEKAMANGWRYDYSHSSWTLEDVMADFAPNGEEWDNAYYMIIFQHDFAKALWGEGTYYDPEEGKTYWVKQDSRMVELGLEQWEFHIQQMVRERNPLKYIERYL